MMRFLSISRSVQVSILSIICMLLLSGTASAHERVAGQQVPTLQEQKYTMQQVQKVSASNSAAFVMNFSIQYLDPNTGVMSDAGKTDNYPVGQQRTIDLDTLGIPDGSLVRPSVNAILGTSNPGNQFVRYVKG